eukprot:3952220-Alexandrium_andersonii.AAC.1
MEEGTRCAIQPTRPPCCLSRPASAQASNHAGDTVHSTRAQVTANRVCFSPTARGGPARAAPAHAAHA